MITDFLMTGTGTWKPSLTSGALGGFYKLSVLQGPCIPEASRKVASGQQTVEGPGAGLAQGTQQPSNDTIRSDLWLKEYREHDQESCHWQRQIEDITVIAGGGGPRWGIGFQLQCCESLHSAGLCLSECLFSEQGIIFFSLFVLFTAATSSTWVWLTSCTGVSCPSKVP